MKAAIYTLGCKVNQYESQALGEKLRENGYELVAFEQDADVYIINSCTVTAEADRKTRQHLRKCRRAHPESVIVLTGCMPQAFPNSANAWPQADIVIGNRNNDRLIDLLNTFQKNGRRVVAVAAHETGEQFASCVISSFEERTRAYVKIQDGCNRFCSYCIIPMSRGRVRSKPLAELEKELQKLASNGYREIVLVGINLSAYGQDLGCEFADAVELACGISGIERVRLGSLEPDHLTDAVIERLSRCKKLCPHFHLSLQSGCNNTLRSMNRHYTTGEFRALCGKLRSSFPNCTLSTDVMVGFCGESEADFEESCAFVREIGFEKLHVFPYSVRPGTKAASMPGHLAKQTKEQRCGVMLRLGAELRQTYLASLVGKTTSVLFESTHKDGYWFGYTANYTPVRAKSEEPLCGSIRDVRITGAQNDEYCEGVLL